MLIVHDFAYHYGGAERVTEAFAEAFPRATVLVIGGSRKTIGRMGLEHRIRSLLPLDRFEASYRLLAPLYPLIASRCDASVVLSSSYAFAHHVRGRLLHVEYCHSPLRQVWIAQEDYRRSSGRAISTGLRVFDPWLKRRDLQAAARVDCMIANSQNVRERIHAIYRREATVLPPPVDTNKFFPAPVIGEPDLALIVARLVEPYKAVRSVLDAFGRLPFRLAIAGEGRDEKALKSLAPRNVAFLGALADDELREWYSRAKILIFPGLDDFGLVPVEAMCCGTPVVALDAGGARETVVDGVTGLRFSPGSLAAAVTDAMTRTWDPARIQAHAQRFSRTEFVPRIREIMRAAAEREELPLSELGGA